MSGEGEDMLEEEEEEEDERPNRLQELQEKYDQLLELNERALQHNVALQRRVIQRRAQDVVCAVSRVVSQLAMCSKHVHCFGECSECGVCISSWSGPKGQKRPIQAWSMICSRSAVYGG